jgi:membrane protease YdiL (CAAX protease family)
VLLLDGLRRLPFAAEFTVIIVGAFGTFFAEEAWLLISSQESGPISQAHLEWLLVFEPAVFLVLITFLGFRGWRFKQVGLRPTPADTILGLLLTLGTYVALQVIWLLAAAVSPYAGRAATATSYISPGYDIETVIAVSIVNPIFEEVFVSGYVVTALKRRASMWTAINVSVAIRLLYHLYQGPGAAITILPLALIFAYVYARWERLWPLIIAHAAFDFLALTNFLAGN